MIVRKQMMKQMTIVVNGAKRVILYNFQALLTMLINKVGDPNYKLAAKVSDYLTKLGRF